MRSGFPILSSIAAVIVSFWLVSRISEGNVPPFIIPETLIVTIKPEQVAKCRFYLTGLLMLANLVVGIFRKRGNLNELLYTLTFDSMLSCWVIWIGDGEIFSFPTSPTNTVTADYIVNGIYFGLLLSIWGVLSTQLDRILIDIPWPRGIISLDHLEEEWRNVDREMDTEIRGNSLLSDQVQEILGNEPKTQEIQEAEEAEEHTKPKSRWQILLERMNEMEGSK